MALVSVNMDRISGRKFGGIGRMSVMRSVLISLLVSSCVGISDAAAVTAEVAKKCDVLVAKAFPPRVPGNPAAGNLNGSMKDQRSYFAKCLANGGNMGDNADKPKDAK